MSGDGRPNQDDSGYVPQSTLHDRIRAKVETERAEGTADARQCDHADRILDRHRVHRATDEQRSLFCAKCGGVVPYPCPEVRDLAEAWGISDA